MDVPVQSPPSNVAASPAHMFHFYKWSTFVSMYIGYTVNMLSRKSFSFALPAIIQDGLDKDDLGELWEIKSVI